MRLNFSPGKKLIGVLITILFLLGIGAILAYDKIPLWFSTVNVYHSHFSTGLGLKAGSEIILRGINYPIGEVTEVEFQPDNSFYVSYEVDSEYANRIRSDTIAFLITPAFGLGSASIELSIGSYDLIALADDSVIPSYESMEGEAIRQAERYRDEQPVAVDQILTNIATLTKQLNDDNGPILGMLRNLNGIIRQFAEGDGLPMLVSSPDFYDTLLSQIQSVGYTLYDVNDITVEVDQIVSDLELSLDSIGWTVRKIIVNTREELETIIRDVSRIILGILDGAHDQITVLMRNFSVNLDPFLRQIVSSISTMIGGIITDIRGSVSGMSQDIMVITGNLRTLIRSTSASLNETTISVQNILNDLMSTINELSENTFLFPEDDQIRERNYLPRDVREDN